MAFSATAGIQTPYQSINANVIQPEVYRLAINWFPNRTPLFSRLPKRPLGSMSFYMNSDNYRPRNPIARVNSAYTSTGTSITVTDGTVFDVGDVLLIDSERFLVSAVNTNNTITVTPSFENTSQANHANNAAITLITNVTDGAQVDKAALSRLPSSVVQYSQTVHHAYQTGGALQSSSNYMGGSISPFERDQAMAIQHTVDDFEGALIYGKGTTGGASSTLGQQTMKGLKAAFTTNNTTSATNGSAYKPTDFIADGLQKCFNAGGQPNTLICSQDFLGGMARWGWLLQRLVDTPNELGVLADTFVVPFLGGTRIIPHPLMASGTFAVFNDAEVRIALKRKLFVQQRGIRGDAMEGDVIIEGALDVENEYKGAWVEGVTGFAVQS